MTREPDPHTEMPEQRALRPRDSRASKEALFDAARSLFSQKGFERTTLRDIGESAGVDAALIARYFGSKAELYLAVLAADRIGAHDSATALEGEAASSNLAGIAEGVLSRSDEHGLGPIVQALIRADTSVEIREAARERLARRLVDPLLAIGQDQGETTLGAELAASALLGISIARTLGWFDELQQAPREEVVRRMLDTLERLVNEAPAPESP
jgi:AcrR family transcriptional regulator